MSINSFSSLNVTFSFPSLSSSNLSIYIHCYFSTTGQDSFISFTVVNILLLLPLYILVLYMGVQRWRRQCSAHGGRSISHSDLFTYHMVMIELIGVLGLVLQSYSMSVGSVSSVTLWTCIFCFIFGGQNLFHCLTCVERYLAVVHPIIYLQLRDTGGVRIRNISIGCVWLLCFGWASVPVVSQTFPTNLFLSVLGLSFIVVLFCSLSVLYALIRPGPGKVSGHRDGADQSKRRAFRIMTAILGALLLRFVGCFVSFSLSGLVLLHRDLCVLVNCGIFLTLPGSLVLPLLFLHRAGKLSCCRQSTESG